MYIICGEPDERRTQKRKRTIYVLHSTTVHHSMLHGIVIQAATSTTEQSTVDILPLTPCGHIVSLALAVCLLPPPRFLSMHTQTHARSCIYVYSVYTRDVLRSLSDKRTDIHFTHTNTYMRTMHHMHTHCVRENTLRQ